MWKNVQYFNTIFFGNQALGVFCFKSATCRPHLTKGAPPAVVRLHLVDLLPPVSRGINLQIK
jgi:hypothetical protein